MKVAIVNGFKTQNVYSQKRPVSFQALPSEEITKALEAADSMLKKRGSHTIKSNAMIKMMDLIEKMKTIVEENVQEGIVLTIKKDLQNPDIETQKKAIDKMLSCGYEKDILPILEKSENREMANYFLKKTDLKEDKLNTFENTWPEEREAAAKYNAHKMGLRLENLEKLADDNSLKEVYLFVYRHVLAGWRSEEAEHLTLYGLEYEEKLHERALALANKLVSRGMLKVEQGLLSTDITTQKTAVDTILNLENYSYRAPLHKKLDLWLESKIMPVLKKPENREVADYFLEKKTIDMGRAEYDDDYAHYIKHNRLSYLNHLAVDKKHIQEVRELLAISNASRKNRILAQSILKRLEELPD